ncbi:hypothetical protein [Paenibacillus sp. FSL R10-2734]|uniref:hypothetical protein n=1 Tax=Paenibacillus sp. FSL R10-2734 TaxID=2954691 RepID=UPI0030D6DB25
MVKVVIRKSLFCLLLVFIFMGTHYAKAEESSDNRVVIRIFFYQNNEENMIYPHVVVETIDLRTGERIEEDYDFKEFSFAPTAGYNLNDGSDNDKGENFQHNGSYYTTKINGELYGYVVYKSSLYTVTTWEDSEYRQKETSEEKLYSFNYKTKELKLLKTATQKKNLIPPFYTYFISADNQKIRENHIDYKYSGQTIGGLYLDNDLYTFTDNDTKVTQLITLSSNQYITNTESEYLYPKNEEQCRMGRCYESKGDSTIDKTALIFKKNGKNYEIAKGHKINEIKEMKLQWDEYQWKMRIANNIFGLRRINGWDYLIRTDTTGKIEKISDRHSFVRETSVSPDNKYLVSFEASYDKDTRKYKDEQLRIYDIKNNKQVRIIKLPYRELWPETVKWHTNTILEYEPFSSSGKFYIRTVNIDILTGIITKDLPGGWNRTGDYVINKGDSVRYFSFARPLEIIYKDKQIRYTKQPSFEGANGLVYCSVKDLAYGLGAAIKFESGKIKLSLNGKTATVDLSDEQVIMYEGTAYAPIKNIILKLGLQYKRADFLSPKIVLE